jgi:hypothetical protein
MKSMFQKHWLFVTAFALILIGSSFIIAPFDNTTYIIVDDVNSMLHGEGDNDRTARTRKLPEKIKVPTPSITFKGRTVIASDTVLCIIRQVTPAGAPGPIVVQGKKKIPYNQTTEYQFPLTVTPLTLNVWYSIELTFKHKNGYLITQKGQIMRTNQ